MEKSRGDISRDASQSVRDPSWQRGIIAYSCFHMPALDCVHAPVHTRCSIERRGSCSPLEPATGRAWTTSRGSSSITGELACLPWPLRRIRCDYSVFHASQHASCSSQPSTRRACSILGGLALRLVSISMSPFGPGCFRRVHGIHSLHSRVSTCGFTNARASVAVAFM